MDHKETLSDLERAFISPSSSIGSSVTYVPATTIAPPTTPTQTMVAASHSQEIGELGKALAMAQADMGHAKKDSTNPHFKSKYADLAAVWDAIGDNLAKQGVSVVQAPSASGNTVRVDTMLIHSSGQWIRSSLSFVCADTRAQTLGSGITYARRYALAAMVGIAPHDDDGNLASGKDQQALFDQPEKRPYTPYQRKAVPGKTGD